MIIRYLSYLYETTIEELHMFGTCNYPSKEEREKVGEERRGESIEERRGEEGRGWRKGEEGREMQCVTNAQQRRVHPSHNPYGFRSDFPVYRGL
jgi:hypothetical protein